MLTPPLRDSIDTPPSKFKILENALLLYCWRFSHVCDKTASSVISNCIAVQKVFCEIVACLVWYK